MDTKQTKYQLQDLYDQFVENVHNGELPSEQDVRTFIRLFEHFVTFVDFDMTAECEDFIHLSKQLLHAVKKQSLSEAIQLVDSLNDAKSYCHDNLR